MHLAGGVIDPLQYYTELPAVSVFGESSGDRFCSALREEGGQLGENAKKPGV